MEVLGRVAIVHVVHGRVQSHVTYVTRHRHITSFWRLHFTASLLPPLGGAKFEWESQGCRLVNEPNDHMLMVPQACAMDERAHEWFKAYR